MPLTYPQLRRPGSVVPLNFFFKAKTPMYFSFRNLIVSQANSGGNAGYLGSNNYSLHQWKCLPLASVIEWFLKALKISLKVGK